MGQRLGNLHRPPGPAFIAQLYRPERLLRPFLS
jgi:hypothetical protein